MFTVPGEPLTVGATILGYAGSFPITNTMVMAVFNLVVFILLSLFASTFSVTKPGKLQLAIESLLSVITGLIGQIAGDKKVAARIMPLVATLVIFILVSNLITTILPILSGFTYEGHALFRSHTNDFNTTLALAVGMIVVVQMYSIGKFNPIGHIGRYFPIHKVIAGFRGGIKSGVLSLLEIFLGALDLVSEFARVVSLSLRLFGNMFAGELLVGILMTMLAIGLPVPIIMLATLSGVIQSIVFGSLVASYLGGVLKD